MNQLTSEVYELENMVTVAQSLRLSPRLSRMTLPKHQLYSPALSPSVFEYPRFDGQDRLRNVIPTSNNRPTVDAASEASSKDQKLLQQTPRTQSSYPQRSTGKYRIRVDDISGDTNPSNCFDFCKEFSYSTEADKHRAPSLAAVNCHPAQRPKSLHLQLPLHELPFFDGSSTLPKSSSLHRMLPINILNFIPTSSAESTWFLETTDGAWRECQAWLRSAVETLVTGIFQLSPPDSSEHYDSPLERNVTPQEIERLREEFLMSERLLDFVIALKSGEFLCRFLATVNPKWLVDSTIHENAISSDFLSSKNVDNFLKSCKRTFNMKQQELFAPNDLILGEEFGKVIKCIQSISTNPHFKEGYSRLGLLEPAPLIISKYQRYQIKHELESCDELYSNLNDVYYDYRYSHSSTTRDDVFSTPLDELRRGSIIEEPTTKLHFVINEIVSTEQIFNREIQGLFGGYKRILANHYGANHRYVQQIFVETDIEEVVRVHACLLSEITRSQGNVLTLAAALNEEGLFRKITECYCVYIIHQKQASQCVLEILMDGDSVIKDLLKEEDKRLASNKDVKGAFTLKESIMAPFQRILRIPLLMQSLCDAAKKDSTLAESTKEFVIKTKKRWDNLAHHLNTCKRDADDESDKMLQLRLALKIKSGEEGRCLKDEFLDLTFEEGSSKPKAMKNAHIFLFQKLLVFKPNQFLHGDLGGNKRDRLYLENYVAEKIGLETGLNNIKDCNSTAARRSHKIKGQTFIVKVRGPADVMTLYCKSEKQCELWFDLLRRTTEDCSADGTQTQKHHFRQQHIPGYYNKCQACGLLIEGLVLQGHRCCLCGILVHMACKKTDQLLPVCQGSMNSQYPEPGTYQNETDLVQAESQESGRGPSTDTLNCLEDSVHRIGLNGITKVEPIIEEEEEQNTEDPIDPLGLWTYPWFVGMQNKEVIAWNIRDMSPGTFAIRKSDQSAGYAIAIKTHQGKCEHIRIETMSYLGQVTYLLYETHRFQSIPELVDFYKSTNLGTIFPGKINTPLLKDFTIALKELFADAIQNRNIPISCIGIAKHPLQCSLVNAAPQTSSLVPIRQGQLLLVTQRSSPLWQATVAVAGTQSMSVYVKRNDIKIFAS